MVVLIPIDRYVTEPACIKLKLSETFHSFQLTPTHIPQPPYILLTKTTDRESTIAIALLADMDDHGQTAQHHKITAHYTTELHVVYTNENHTVKDTIAMYEQ